LADIIEFVSKNSDLRQVKPEHKEHYEKVVTQATRHCERSEMDELYELARPNEEAIYTQWRKDNRRYITVAPILSFKLMLVRVLQQSLQDIQVDEYPNIREFAYDDLMTLALADPNAVIVEWPFIPGNKQLAPSTPVNDGGIGPNKKIASETLIIASKDIVAKDEKFLVFKKGEIEVRYSDKDTKSEPYYAGVDEKAFYVIMPYVGEKKELKYKVSKWYTHGYKKDFWAVVPGYNTKEGYKESICWGAYEYLDEAVIALSSDQVIRIRHSHPKLVINADLTCPTCNGKATETIQGKAIPCRQCNGAGSLQNIGDFATVKVRQTAAALDKGGSSNPIYYVQSPGGIEYPMTVWEKLIAKAERQLCTDLLEGTGNESGVSKEMRMEPKQDLLRMFGEQFCKMLTTVVNNRLQLVNINKDLVSIVAPIYYESKSPDYLKMEMEASLPGERFIKYMQYVKAKFRGDDKTILAHKMAVLYAPLLLYRADELELALQTGSYSEQDIKRRDYAIYAMTEIVNEPKFDEKPFKDFKEAAEKKLKDMGVISDPPIQLPADTLEPGEPAETDEPQT
jgi:hypothetical protein